MKLRFFNYPLFLLTTLKTVKLWKLSKFGSDFQCVYYNNKFVVLHVYVCMFFILESLYVCMERWCFNLHIHLIKSFHTLVVPLLCLEPCAGH